MSTFDAVMPSHTRRREDTMDTGHKCTASSATQIAQQLPGAPWYYSHSYPAGAALSGTYSTQHYNVTTPMGAKSIPVKFQDATSTIVLTCPYTGEQFVFSKRPNALGVVGVVAPSPPTFNPSGSAPAASSMSTGTKVAIGIGAVVVLGFGWQIWKQRKR